MNEEEWNDLTKDQQGDWIEYWSNLENEEQEDEWGTKYIFNDSPVNRWHSYSQRLYDTGDVMSDDLRITLIIIMLIYIASVMTWEIGKWLS